MIQTGHSNPIKLLAQWFADIFLTASKRSYQLNSLKVQPESPFWPFWLVCTIMMSGVAVFYETHGVLNDILVNAVCLIISPQSTFRPSTYTFANVNFQLTHTKRLVDIDQDLHTITVSLCSHGDECSYIRLYEIISFVHLSTNFCWKSVYDSTVDHDSPHIDMDRCLFPLEYTSMSPYLCELAGFPEKSDTCIDVNRMILAQAWSDVFTNVVILMLLLPSVSLYIAQELLLSLLDTFTDLGPSPANFPEAWPLRYIPSRGIDRRHRHCKACDLL